MVPACSSVRTLEILGLCQAAMMGFESLSQCHSLLNSGYSLCGERISHSVVSDSLQFYGLSMGFSGQEYWNGLSFPSPGDLPNPGIKPGSPVLQAESLPSELPGKHIYQ